jgi:hypothetical protein
VHSFFTRSLVSLSDDLEGDVYWMEERRQMILAGSTSLRKVSFELNLLPGFKAFSLQFLRDQRLKHKLAVYDLIDEIEVNHNGLIEVVYFPIPKEIGYLNAFEQDKFLNKVSFDTAEVRMKELMVAAPRFVSEMVERYKLAQRFLLYRILSQNIAPIKWLIYGLVVLLNINVMMAGYVVVYDLSLSNLCMCALFDMLVTCYIHCLYVWFCL